MVDKKAKSIELKAKSNNEFFLIHGYTGSSTDFNGLPIYLNKVFNANVRVIRLIGHGTKIEDLDDISYFDFLNQVEKELKKDIRKGRKIVLGGVSFGAQLALILASKYKIEGVFSVSPPYKMKFPFNIKGIEVLGNITKYYKYIKKRRSPLEEKLREGKFSYDSMHINGLKVVREANNVLKANLNKIDCPVFLIHSLNDPISTHKSIFSIQQKVKSNLKTFKILKSKPHNIFYSDDCELLCQDIINFAKNNNLFNQIK